MKIKNIIPAIILDLCYAMYLENPNILEDIEEHCEVTFDQFFSPENSHQLGCMPVFKEVDNESNSISKASYLAYHFLRVHSVKEKTLKVVESLKELALESDPHYRKLLSNWENSRNDAQDRALHDAYELQQLKASSSGNMA